MQEGLIDEREVERDLVVRAQRGDGAAREALACRLRPLALRLAQRLVGGRDEAQDVAQEAMLRFFTRLDLLDPRRPVLPWLRRIVCNRAVDHHRRCKARLAESIDSGGWEEGPVEVRSGEAGPESRLARRELSDRIWCCLDELTPTQRQILLLREYQDLAYREIAEVLSIPLGTVMSRLHAARGQLRLRLQELGREDRRRRARALGSVRAGRSGRLYAPCAG